MVTLDFRTVSGSQENGVRMTFLRFLKSEQETEDLRQEL